MKKAIIKPTLAVVAVAASCFGAWKAYDAYGSVDNSLMMQNIEALTQNTNLEGESYILVPLADGPCYGLEPTGKTQQNNQGAYQQEMMYKKGDDTYEMIEHLAQATPMTEEVPANKPEPSTFEPETTTPVSIIEDPEEPQNQEEWHHI